MQQTGKSLAVLKQAPTVGQLLPYTMESCMWAIITGTFTALPTPLQPNKHPYQNWRFLPLDFPLHV
jgi:hypothetical protein